MRLTQRAMDGWNRSARSNLYSASYFATFNLRAKGKVQIILHLGAKKRDNTAEVTIADPETLLEWLGTDRAAAGFSDLNDIEAKQSAFAQVIRQWIKHV